MSEKKRFKPEYILAAACGAVILLFVCSIAYELADLVLRRTGVRTEEEEYAINWEELYPFEEESGQEAIETPAFEVEYVSWVRMIQEKIEAYTTDQLKIYFPTIILAASIEDAAGWNFTSYNEYNGVVKLPDGSLAEFMPEVDTTNHASALIDFASWCRQEEMDFLYIQAPYSICKYENSDISGTMDFSNQNADLLLQAISSAGVDTWDMRALIHEEGLSHAGMFFRTDHHWKGESGLWAARKILKVMQSEYGYNVEPSLLEEDKFEYVTYPDWFLGSRGKKMTLARTEPEDFTLIYPKYPTEVHFSIPNRAVDGEGDFSVMYDMSCVETVDYYNLNPHDAYCYGNNPVTTIKNRLANNDYRVLIIKDSFANCVAPFLSLGVRYVDVLDLRSFTGSEKSYIRDISPDMVIVMYNPSMLGNKSTWDIR